MVRDSWQVMISYNLLTMVSHTPYRSCWGVSSCREGQHSLTMHKGMYMPVTGMNVSTSLLTSGVIVLSSVVQEWSTEALPMC